MYACAARWWRLTRRVVARPQSSALKCKASPNRRRTIRTTRGRTITSTISSIPKPFDDATRIGSEQTKHSDGLCADERKPQQVAPPLRRYQDHRAGRKRGAGPDEEHYHRARVENDEWTGEVLL